MSTFFLIPLSNIPQKFQIVLAGVTYLMAIKWNNSDDAGWVIDLSDQNDTPIATNIPLITGEDCLDGLEYLGIDGQLYVQSSGSNPLDVPTFSNLGIDCNLFFATSVPNG